MVPVVSTDYSFLAVKWQLVSFFLFSLAVGFLHRLHPRVFNSRRQPHYPNTVVVATWMTFIKCYHLPKPKLGAFQLLVSCFLPSHQRPQWVGWGVISAWARTVVWPLLALHIQPILVPACDSISMRDFSFRTGCIHGPIFSSQPLSD